MIKSSMIYSTGFIVPDIKKVVHQTKGALVALIDDCNRVVDGDILETHTAFVRLELYPKSNIEEPSREGGK